MNPKRLGYAPVQLSCQRAPYPQHHCFTTSVRLRQQKPKAAKGASPRGARSSLALKPTYKDPGISVDIPQPSPLVDHELDEVDRKANLILKSTTVPDEATVHEFMETCQALSESLAKWSDSAQPSNTPTSGLLDLAAERKRDTGQLALATAMRERAVERLSKLAYTTITAPQVFISPRLLSTYVNTQSLLGRPETIPPIFLLYASKPIPQPNTAPIRYKSSNPKKASSAVPFPIANAALTSAIKRRNLPVCLDIINTSVSANAFRRAKFLKRALVPCFGLGLAPLATYTAASRWAVWQDTLDIEMAKNMMFAGLLAYVSFTATLGVVAITTANDQMNRVTWASGTPLRERWFREEERAMVDRVACAWGFEESLKRGEEDGFEWQQLREWVGLRRMVLDNVELMEGME
ncbi:MAG: hypothetical protein Q9191_000421 [Dirinaria sp. TL-2023a]